MTAKGVDISEMNGSVDFGALRKAGVQFVLIRCGYGSDYVHQDDARFHENVAKAEQAGMPWGTYLYSYALNGSMAKSEASHTLRLLEGRKPAYGVWYDVEDPSQAQAGLPAICQAYCKAIEGQGLYVGVYSMLSWWESKLDSPLLDAYDKWVAQWAGACTYQKPYGMWQFTDKWNIGGRAFDGNWAYRDYPALTGSRKEGQGVSYEEFKAFMERYRQEQAAKPVSGWAKPAVEFAKAQGLMVGDAGSGFRGQSPVTRQELAQVLFNQRGGGDGLGAEGN